MQRVFPLRSAVCCTLTKAIGGSRRFASNSATASDTAAGTTAAGTDSTGHSFGLNTNFDEADLLKDENAMKARVVQFAAASSDETNPKMAANEAFDLAANAMTTTPNFCWFFVSMDNTQMDEAPEVLWHALRRVNRSRQPSDGADSSAEDAQKKGAEGAAADDGYRSGAVHTKTGEVVDGAKAGAPRVHMFGSAVTNQRLDGGYVRVLLASIPDLEMEPFTYDQLPVPEARDGNGEGPPPPFACITTLDPKLTLVHGPIIDSRLNALSSSLQCPTVGCVLNPALNQRSTDPEDDVKRKPMPIHELPDSLTFVNDSVFRGSACGVVLRSNLVQADCVVQHPSIKIGGTKVDRVDVDQSNGAVQLLEFDAGVKPTEYVKRLYVTELKELPQSKVFIGLTTPDGDRIVLPFRGDPQTGSLTIHPPPGVTVNAGDEVVFVCDDVQLDTEQIAEGLFSYEKKDLKNVLSRIESVRTKGEKTKEVLSSSVACVHFSQPNLNVLARPSTEHVAIDLSGAPQFAPHLAKRILGSRVVTSGVYCPGQVTPFTDVIQPKGAAKKESDAEKKETWSPKSYIASRSSVQCVFHGLE